MVKSTFVFESGTGIGVGVHGEHDYVFHSGDPVADNGRSTYIFESGTGLGPAAIAELVDDFEDGDETPEAGYSGWTIEPRGGTVEDSDFEPQTNVVLEGTYSARLSVNDRNEYDILVYVTRDSTTDAVQNIRFSMRVEQQHGEDSDGCTIALRNGDGRRFAGVYFSMAGNVYGDVTRSNLMGSYSTQTKYDVWIENIDYQDENYDIKVSNVGEQTSNGFSDTPSEFGGVGAQVEIITNASDTDMYYDNIDIYKTPKHF